MRVTIVHIPDQTKQDPISGKILVEADGIQKEIDASVFYNSIKGKDELSGKVIISGAPLIGLGGSVPTRGETDKSTF